MDIVKEGRDEMAGEMFRRGRSLGGNVGFRCHGAGRSSRAFTLAEIVVTMGIAATVLVALLGLLPAGLEQARQGTALTVGSQIVQGLVSEVQLSGWSVDRDYRVAGEGLFVAGEADEESGAYLFYYGQDGTRVAAADDPGRIFTARVSLVPGGVRVPGAKAHLGGRDENPFVLRLRVEVTDVPGASWEFFEPGEDGGLHPRIRVYSTTVASLEPIAL